MNCYFTKKMMRTLGLTLALGASAGLTSGYAIGKSAMDGNLPLRLVVTKTTDTNDGTCDRDCSLREAITAANATANDAVVTFDWSFYRGAQMIQLNGKELSVKANGRLTIEGPGAERLTISGNYQSRIFHVAVRDVLTLNHLTISEGEAKDDYYGLSGGGIYSKGTLVLNHCTVTENTTGAASHAGGGIYNDAGTLTLNSCLITANDAMGATGLSAGGGIHNEKGILVITKSTIRGNSSRGGGTNYGCGVYSRLGTLELAESTVEANTVQGDADSNYGGGFLSKEGGR